jgi:predicted PurR-regulated permease PerM
MQDIAAAADRWVRFLMALGGLVLLVAALYWAKAVLLPVVLATLLTFVLSPLVTALQRVHVPRLAAVLATVVLALAVLGGLGRAVYSQVESLVEELPQRKAEIVRKITDVQGSMQGSLLDRVAKAIKDVTREVKKAENPGPTDGKTEPIPVTVVSGSTPTYLLTFASPALEVILQAALVVVLLIFMLLQREDLRNRVIRLSGEGSITLLTKALDDAAGRISRFLLAQLLINGCFGMLAATGLWIIGVPYPLVWGLLAGALRYLPYIGAYVGATLPLLVALILLPTWTPVLLTIILFVCLELITANVVEPWIFGHSIGVSEVALLIAAAFWAWLWGPLGLVLSTPLTACLAVLGKYVPQLEFFDVLLGDEPVLSPDVRYYQRLLARDEDEAARLVEEYHQEHGGGEVFDKVLLPALLLTAINRDRGRLSEDDEHFIFQTTREVIDDLPAVPAEADQGRACATEAGRRWQPAPAAGVLVLGCPAHGEGEGIVLLMLQQMLDPARCRLEVLSADTLAAEVLQRVENEKPAAVFIASLPPRGLTHTRYLCKRLRSKFPRLKILVLLLGRDTQREPALARLRTAGADLVASSLEEGRSLLLPLVQVMALNHEQQQVAATAV